MIDRFLKKTSRVRLTYEGGSTPSAIAWAYGMFRPTDWGPDCDAEMQRMNALWNKLVEIDRAISASYREMIAGALDPAIAAERNALLARLDELKAERNKRHAAARKKVPTPDLDAEIETARAQYRESKERYAAAKAAARVKTAAAARALEQSRQAQVKLARQESGCYWGNYNAVINSFDGARQKILKAGGELHFRKFDGTGRIVNQIQGGITVDALFAGTNSQVQLRPATAAEWPKRRLRPQAHILTANVFTTARKPRHVSWPLILDRPFPQDAIIKEVHIVRRKDEWTVSFSLAARMPAPIPAGAACGMDIGWRRLNDGIRVATLINDRGERDFVVLPEAIVSGFRYLDELASRRDTRLNGLIAMLRALPWAEAPPALGDTAKAMLGAPRLSARALARLEALWAGASEWRRDAYEMLHEQLTNPYDSDRRDWKESTGLRQRLLRARRDHYRIEAKRIAGRYGLIGGEKLSISSMSAVENNPTPEPSRWYRKVAAPAEFIGALKWAVKKAGGRYYEHEGPSTWICHECGVVQAPRDPAALVATCPACNAVWDQDVNAAANLLAAALAATEDGAALASVLPPPGGGRWGRAKKAAAEHRERSQEQ